jgi:hypothetical protein
MNDPSKILEILVLILSVVFVGFTGGVIVAAVF